MEILTATQIFDFVKFGIIYGFSLGAFIGLLGIGINTLISVFNIITNDN